jgi:nitroreductase
MDTISNILERRTVRVYKNEPIDSVILDSIFNAGCRASTTGNMQLYSIINTTSPELKAKLAPTHFNQKMVVQAPHVLTFCADFNRFKRWCLQRDALPGYDNFLSFMTAAIDALLVAQNVATAAESVGLGICYLGTTLYNAQEIIEILEIPKGVVPITTLTMGWPAEDSTQVDRLPLNTIVHNDVYQNYSNEFIDEVYTVKETLTANLKFVEENKKKTLAQVFTDIRYKKADNEFFSEKLLSVLKEQGFL